MLPLFGIAETDPDEGPWRAAAEAIHQITKMDFYKFITERHTPKDRKDYFDQRELDWKRPRQSSTPPAP